MATIKKSLRIDQETADKVSSLKAEGESESAAYSRVISAGVAALEGNQQGGGNDEANDQSGAPNQAEHISDLRAIINDLRGQVEAKDKQIDRLQELIAQAHRLHMTEQERVVALALPSPKKGLGQRIREFFTGEKEQQANQ